MIPTRLTAALVGLVLVIVLIVQLTQEVPCPTC